MSDLRDRVVKESTNGVISRLDEEVARLTEERDAIGDEWNKWVLLHKDWILERATLQSREAEAKRLFENSKHYAKCAEEVWSREVNAWLDGAAPAQTDGWMTEAQKWKRECYKQEAEVGRLRDALGLIECEFEEGSWQRKQIRTALEGREGG